MLLAVAAGGIRRIGNVRYHIVIRAVNARGKHGMCNAEWHPKRATFRATDTVNITFGARTFIGCYTRSPSRNIFQTCQAESLVLSHAWRVRRWLRPTVACNPQRLSLDRIRRNGNEMPWERSLVPSSHKLLHKHWFRYRDVDVNGVSRNIHMHSPVRSQELTE